MNAEQMIELVEARNLDALETEWLAAIEENMPIDEMGPVRRIAIGAGQPGSVLNLAPQDPADIKHPERGDVILVEGKRFPDGRPRLAVYDGKGWLYAEMAPAGAQGAEK